MGRSFLHRCGACGYEAEVSGGPDRGNLATTITVSCGKCQALYDVVETWGSGWREGPLRRVAPRCPKHESHTVRPWTSGDPCPRCGRRIAQGEAAKAWD